jgi:predicted GNAT family N-acyltransferase
MELAPVEFREFYNFLLEHAPYELSYEEYYRENRVRHAMLTDSTTKQIVATAELVLDDASRVHLHRVVVHKEYRGQGFCQYLLKRLFEEYPDEEYYCIVTHPQLAKILENNGFLKA